MPTDAPTSNCNLPAPLIPAPWLLATDPEPPRKKLKIKKAELKKKWLEIVPDEVINKEDHDLETFIRLNWDSIRTFAGKRPVQNLFNFYCNNDMCNLIARIAKAMMKNRKKNQFKINYGFGFALSVTNNNFECLRYSYLLYFKVYVTDLPLLPLF